MRNKTEEMEAMRKTIETMQIEREQREIEHRSEIEARNLQREIEHRSEIEARDLQIAEANSRADTAVQNLVSIVSRHALNPPTIPGKLYNNEYIMRKLKLLLIQRRR